MNSQNSDNLQTLTPQQQNYQLASQATCHRFFYTACCVVGFAVSSITMAPAGITITALAASALGMATVAACLKERQLGKELDRLGKERTPYILR